MEIDTNGQYQNQSPSKQAHYQKVLKKDIKPFAGFNKIATFAAPQGENGPPQGRLKLKAEKEEEQRENGFSDFFETVKKQTKKISKNHLQESKKILTFAIPNGGQE